MAKTSDWNLEQSLQNFHPEPVRTAARAYLKHCNVQPNDRDADAFDVYTTLSRIIGHTDEYLSPETEPALRVVAEAWVALRETLVKEVMGRLEQADRPLHLSAFLGWGDTFDSARNAHTIFALFALSRSGDLWRADLEDDSAVFGLHTFAPPADADEAWAWLESDQPWPTQTPPLPDRATQDSLFEGVARD